MSQTFRETGGLADAAPSEAFFALSALMGASMSGEEGGEECSIARTVRLRGGGVLRVRLAGLRRSGQQMSISTNPNFQR